MFDQGNLQAQMCYLTLILSLYFSLSPEETAVSRIALINKGFRSKGYRGGARGNFVKHRKISIFFALFRVQKWSKQKTQSERNGCIMYELHAVQENQGYVFEAVL